MNWEDLLPIEEARMQVSIERRRRIARARAAGATFGQIADRLGVSESRARSLYLQSEPRALKWDVSPAMKRFSPVNLTRWESAYLAEVCYSLIGRDWLLVASPEFLTAQEG